MIYKRCSRCGKRLPSGTKCLCSKKRHKEYDKYSRDKQTDRFYHSTEWKKTKKEVLDIDGGIDVYLFMTEGLIEIADTAHHIIPLKDDWNRRCDSNNLMSLHHDTHSMIEKMYKKDKKGMEKKLKEMLLEYRQRAGGI